MAQITYAPPSLVTSGTTFAQLLTGGLEIVLDNLIAANPAIANPTTAPTVAVTGGGASGGNLAAAVYFVSYTWVDGAGETTAKESATSFTVAAGNIPRVTIPATPTGASGANIYLTAAGGATLTETLYATGITTTTFDLSFAAGIVGDLAPTVNTTGAATVTTGLHRGRAWQLTALYNKSSQFVSQFISGQPVDFQASYQETSKVNYIWAFYQQCTKEILTLMAANPGSLHNKAGLVQNIVYRTFP